MKPAISPRACLVVSALFLGTTCGVITPAAVAAADDFSYADQAGWVAIHGDRQSPIALDSRKAQPDIDDDDDDALHLAGGKMRDMVVVDNGHTIQVNVPPGSFATIRGRRFELQQFHFHAPGEHTIDARRYPLEVHFVYKAKNGKLAVIATMFDIGKANPAIEDILKAVAPKGQSASLASFDVAPLLPGNLSYFHYLGSLTTPPLSQNVEWHVLSAPVTLSQAQLDQFHRHYQGNNRDLQSGNHREVLYFRAK